MDANFTGRCPSCGGDLCGVQKDNVDVDVCIQCEGVWLDKGELMALLSTPQSSRPQPSLYDRSLVPAFQRQI